MEENPQEPIGFWNYARLVFAHIFRKFPFWQDILLGTLVSILTFALQVAWGLIPLRDWQEHKLHWVLSFTLPYAVVLMGHLIWRFTIAPWRLYQDQEKIRLETGAQKSELQKTLSVCSGDLNKALANPSGPDIVFEFAARDQLRIRNLKGGAAHDILIHSFTNGVSDGMICLERRFAFLAEGESQDFSPQIESVVTGHAFGFFKLDAFVHSIHRKQPNELEIIIPFKITFWDGAEKDFTCEFEMYHNFLTKAWRITRTKKLAKLR